jgi:hypothetical protein
VKRLEISASAILFGLAVAFCFHVIMREKQHVLDARQAETRPLQPAARVPLSPPGDVAEAGVQFSSPEAGDAGRTTAGDVAGGLHQPQLGSDPVGLVTPLEAFDGVDGDAFQADASGLYAMTTELWSQCGFVALTTEEARALLPVAGDELGTLPTTIFALVGGFPTMADCEAAWRVPGVQRASRDFLVLEILLTEMQTCPQWRRTPMFAERYARMKSERATALEQLYAACDAAGPYKNWALVGRLFTEWERQ